MKKIIAFRLTEKREKLVRQAQKQLKEENISRLLERALESLVRTEDYLEKIERVKGTVAIPAETDSISRIRELRGGE
ncbi:MAG: hypothetical protein Kow0037_24850 [Calditrichia bacterium]